MHKENIAISVDNVSKNFKLPHERVDSIKSLFVNPLRSKKGLKTETQHALKHISFDIKKGEFFGIVGRNGSGKSTLLKLIAGIYQPSSGTIHVDGRLVPFIELGVGFNPELTGRENVYLNGALMGFSSKEVDEKYASIVEFAELKRFMDQKLKNYSSGMQVRLAFSTATLLANSDILLIDEVLAVGDSSFQRKCFEYFKELKKNKKTVVFVSHDMSAVREYCDRAILIEQSEVVFSGTAEKAAREYTRLFLPEAYHAEREQEKQKKREIEKIKNKGKWGAGGVTISDVKTSKGIYDLAADDTIYISYTIRADHVGYSDDLTLGLSVKDGTGRVLCGTNSDIIQYKDKILMTGSQDTVIATWALPNIFGEGEYTVEPAVVSASSGELLEWWDDAARFRIVNEFTTPYVVSPKMVLTVDTSRSKKKSS